MKKERVVVAMSGGVDSSLAAALLLESGYDVVGMTMRLSDETRMVEPNALSSVEDARRVADVLGISHQVVDLPKPLSIPSLTISSMRISTGVRPIRALSAITTSSSGGFSARQKTSVHSISRRGTMHASIGMRKVFIVCVGEWIMIRISPMCSTI